MKITLEGPFAPNSAANSFDVRQIKKALNRLGYYMPYEKVGITGIPDAPVFEALKGFQKDYGLPVTGTARPDDDTIKAINREATKTPEGEYVWRTVEDEKVRSSHAEYNRKLRRWDDSPDPGEEFNCRCWADAIKTGLTQVVTSSTEQANHKWTDEDFKKHFWHGNGKEVTLAETGWLVDIIYHAKNIMFKRVENQVEEKAREVQVGEFSDTWERSYDFEKVVFSIGNAVIRGRFNGSVKKQGDTLYVEALAYYLLDDDFTDPANIREFIYKTSDPDILVDNVIGKTVLLATDLLGAIYPITGTWTTRITGSIKSAE